MIVSTISKRHHDAICENSFHLKEDQRVHASFTDNACAMHDARAPYPPYASAYLDHLGSIILEIISIAIIMFGAFYLADILVSRDNHVVPIHIDGDNLGRTTCFSMQPQQQLQQVKCTTNRFSSQQLQQHGESILLLMDECTKNRFSIQPQQQQLQQHDESILLLLDECTNNRFSSQQQQQQQM